MGYDGWDECDELNETEYDFLYNVHMFPELPSLSTVQVEKINSVYATKLTVAGRGQDSMMKGEGKLHGRPLTHNKSQTKDSHDKVSAIDDEGEKVCRDTKVLDEYLRNRYDMDNERPLYKPQFFIELSDLKQEGKTNRTKSDRDSAKPNPKMKATWKGISHFTEAEDLYQISGQQLKVCDFFMEEILPEDEDDEEEMIREVQSKLRQRRKRKGHKRTDRKREIDPGWDELDKEEYIRASVDNMKTYCRVASMPVRKEIWGFVQVGREGDNCKERGEFHVALWDSGNLSRSLVSVGFIRRMERQWKKRIKLERYDVPVKGVGGGKVELIGQVRDQWVLFLPGFSQSFKFRPIVTSGKMSHINVSLAEMKEHQISLHLLRDQTLIQDFSTKESVRLFDREKLYEQAIFQLEMEQITKMTNRMRGMDEKMSSVRELRDLSKLERAIKLKLGKSEVLAEEGGSLRFYETINQAWERDTCQLEEGLKEEVFEYPGNLRKDTLAAKQMKIGDPIQTLRPWKNIAIDPNTHAYIPCKVKVPFGGSFFVYPGPETIVQAGGLLVTPSLNQMRDPKGLAYVSVINLTDQKYCLKRSDTIGFLEAIMEDDEYVIEKAESKVVEEGGGGGQEEEKNDMHVKRNPPEKKDDEEEEVFQVGGSSEEAVRYGQWGDLKSSPQREGVEQKVGALSSPQRDRYGQWGDLKSSHQRERVEQKVGALRSPQRDGVRQKVGDVHVSGSQAVSDKCGQLKDIKSHPPEKKERQKGEVESKIWKRDKRKNLLWREKREEKDEEEREEGRKKVEKNYERSGFILLDEKGEVERYLDDDNHSRRRSLWYDNKPGKDFKEMMKRGRLDGELVKEAKVELRENLDQNTKTRHIDQDVTDERHGQKTFSKQQKVKVKEALQDLAKTVRIGDKGTFIRGKINEGRTDIDTSHDQSMIEQEERQERSKRYLDQLSEREIKEFLIEETKLQENTYFKERPLMRKMMLEVMFRFFKAFTPPPNHPYLKYDPGHCKQLIYHPELKPQFKDKIFTTKVQTFSPVDDKELGKILRSWVRAGILRKQDITDPKSRSEHNHRLILVRKKPTEPTYTDSTDSTATERGGARAGAHISDVGILPETTRPKRLCLDLRDLNACSITHKHYMASVHDHLSMLEGGALFTSIDLDNFFSSIPCSELGSKLLSFHCSHGSFSYLRLCQGWSSSPGVASALGARLTSVLDKDTLGLFVDDGLQVGRFRKVSSEKLDMLQPYGDVEAVLKEDEDIWKREGKWNGTGWSEAVEEPARGDTDSNLENRHIPTVQTGHRQNGVTEKESCNEKELLCQTGVPTNPDQGDINRKAHSTFSPTDLIFPEDENVDIARQVLITPGMDLLIKFHDLLKAIAHFNLRLSGRKLRLFSVSCEYLGFEINAEGIKMQPKYLSTITKYKLPKSCSTLKNYLGVTQYFASQAPALHRYTARLYEAANRKVGKGEVWSLTRQEKLDFFFSKLCFLRSDGLGFPDLTNLQVNPLRLWNDFSTLSISSVLTQVQRDKNGVYRDVLLGVFGRKCPKVLQSASSAVGESHALCFGLTKYKALLKLGVFDIFSDHLNLKFLNSWQNLRGIYFRLYQMITQFVFRMYTISSSEMLAADLISRIDNQEMTEDEKRVLGMGDDGLNIYDDYNENTEQPKDLDIKQHWTHQKQQFLLWAADKDSQDSQNSQDSPDSQYSQDRNLEESLCVGEMHLGKWVDAGYVVGNRLGGRSKWHSDQDSDSLGGSGQEMGTHFNPISCSPSSSSSPAQGRPCHTSPPSHVTPSASDQTMDGACLVCPEFMNNSNCTHMKLRFPLGRPEQKIYEFSCLPFRHKSHIIAELGPEHQTLFRTISRFEILEEQKKDRNIQKAIYFTQHGWPSLQNIKQLYPTKILMEMFYLRSKLSCAPDGLLIITRDDQEYALEERTVIPLSLLYHVFCLAHLSTKAFHNSIINTYIAINFRYFVPQLNQTLRYFISRCVVCLQKATKPNRLRRMPINVPNFIHSEAKFNERIFLDLSGCLVESHVNKFRYFLLIVDRYSLFIEVVPLRSVHTEEVKLAFLNAWVSRYGPSTISVSDVGTQFTAEPFQQMLTDLNMIHRFSNTSLPRSEYAEVGIAKIKALIRSCLSSCVDHSDWPMALMMAKLSHNMRICQAKMISPAEIALGEPPALDLWWVSQPGNRNRVVSGPLDKDKHQIIIPQNTKRNDDNLTQNYKKSIWRNGQVQFPVSPIFHGNKQNLDFTRLRKNDPIRLMSKISITKKQNSFLSSPLVGHFLRAGLASMISDNQLVVYARSKPSLSKAKNELFPFTQKDVGRLVFRFNPIPRTQRQAAGTLSASWQGPFVISFVFNEITCIVEGILRGKHVAYRSPIDHIRPFHDNDLATIPPCDQPSDEYHDDSPDQQSDGDDSDDVEDGNDIERAISENEVDQDGVGGGVRTQVNHLHHEERDYHQVAPLLQKEEVPLTHFINVTSQHRKHILKQKCQTLVNLPGSDLLCINPESELIKLGHQQDYDKMKKNLEDIKYMDPLLVFHQIFDTTEGSKTRSQRIKSKELIDTERYMMLMKRSEEDQEGQEKEDRREIIIGGDGDDQLAARDDQEVEREEDQGSHSGGGENQEGPLNGQQEGEGENEADQDHTHRYEPNVEEEGENEGEFVSAEEEEDEEEKGEEDEEKEEGEEEGEEGEEEEEEEKEGDGGSVVNDNDDDLGDHDEKRDERPTKFSALANTVRKRISGHLPEGKYWQLAPDSRRKRRKE